MTDCWGYVRISQEGRDTSIEKQKQSLRDYCAKRDLDLITTLNDGKNTSGFNTDRERYQILTDRIESGEAEAVVVRDRARLSRDFDERLRLITLFRSTDAELHVVEAGGEIELQDVQTAAMEAVHAAMDHAKKMAEIERARDAINERMEKDYDHGRPKFGMEYDDDGHYQVPAENFDTVREILRRREDGQSLPAIAEAVDVARSTVASVCDRREWYAERGELEPREVEANE